jgi:hypothetical protein
MNPRSHSDTRTAMRSVLGLACEPWVGSFAIVGGHADGGFGLVVVDQGNPRRVRGTANVTFATPF